MRQIGILFRFAELSNRLSFLNLHMGYTWGDHKQLSRLEAWWKSERSFKSKCRDCRYSVVRKEYSQIQRDVFRAWKFLRREKLRLRLKHAVSKLFHSIPKQRYLGFCWLPSILSTMLVLLSKDYTPRYFLLATSMQIAVWNSQAFWLISLKASSTYIFLILISLKIYTKSRIEQYYF